MFDYFTSSVLLAEQSFDTACRVIAGCGIKELDIWSIKGWCEHMPPLAPELDIAPIRETLDKHHLHCRAFSMYASSDDIVRSRFKPLHDLGGKVFVRGSDKPTVSVKDFAARVRSLAEAAHDFGVTLAIENHANAVIDSIASMVELCERVNHPGLGIALAPIHLHRRKEETADAIRKLGREHIPLFYAWDWGPTADKFWKDPQEQVPGRGVIPFKPMLKALADIKYDKPLCVFAHGVEHKDIAYAEKAIRDGIAHCKACEPKP